MSNITFNCLKGGKHAVKMHDAKNVYYQYTSRGQVMARGSCPKDGGKLVQFLSKDKVPSGEKIRAADASSGKSARKSKKGSARQTRRSNKSRKSH